MAQCPGWQLDLIPLSLRLGRSTALPNERVPRTLKLHNACHKVAWREGKQP